MLPAFTKYIRKNLNTTKNIVFLKSTTHRLRILPFKSMISDEEEVLDETILGGNETSYTTITFSPGLSLSGNEQDVRSSQSRKEPLPRQPQFSTTSSQATNERESGIRACGKSITREKYSACASREKRLSPRTRLAGLCSISYVSTLM